jgi:hypothetical protein
MNGLFRVFASFGMVVFGAGSSFAQSGWFWQNPLPQGNHLRAVRKMVAPKGRLITPAPPPSAAQVS